VDNVETPANSGFIAHKRNLSAIWRPSWTAVTQIFGELQRFFATDQGCVDPGVRSLKLGKGNPLSVRGKNRPALLPVHCD
jgi:hypothetical protein